jgi:hypothetical protein
MLLISMPTSDPNPDPADPQSYVLDFLVTHQPALFSVDELIREYVGRQDPEMARLYVEEALISLASYGLVHRIGDFVFASRAANQGRALAT